MHNGSSRKRGEEGEERTPDEIMAENFPNLITSLNLHIKETQQTPSRINSKRIILDTSELNCQNPKTKRES